jgi:hypothetical protein
VEWQAGPARTARAHGRMLLLLLWEPIGRQWRRGGWPSSSSSSLWLVPHVARRRHQRTLASGRRRRPRSARPLHRLRLTVERIFQFDEFTILSTNREINCHFLFSKLDD